MDSNSPRLNDCFLESANPLPLDWVVSGNGELGELYGIGLENLYKIGHFV